MSSDILSCNVLFKRMKKANSIQVDLQILSHDPHPSYSDFKQWVDAVFAANAIQRAAVGIRVVDEEESAKLNEFYRHKSGPTNVLSFSYTPPPGLNLMGDLAICAPIVIREAKEQNKPITSHWAHLTVHGSLH